MNLIDLITDKFSVFVEEVIGLDNADFQDELDDVAISNDLYKKICIAIARGHGKSTHCSVAYPAWRIAKDHNRRMLIVSSTATIATSFISQILNHIESNDRYQLWAKAIDPKHLGVAPKKRVIKKMEQQWSSSSITVDRDDLNLKDPSIAGVGLFGSILSKRVDEIIIDDIVNQENSSTPEQRQKIVDWVRTTLFPILAPDGRIVCLGNTWHQDDLMAQLLKDPLFDYKRKLPAIIHDANNQELWEQWANLRMDEKVSLEDRIGNSSSFYASHRLEMDDGVVLLWPQRFKYGDLFLTRLSDAYAFARMYQCDPSSRPDQKFKEEWLNRAKAKGAGLRLQDVPFEGITIDATTQGLDLAISEKETADDTSYLTLDRVMYPVGDIRAGDFIVRQIKAGKFSPNTVREMVLTDFKAVKPIAVRVESNGYQESMARDLDDAGVLITAYHTGGEKRDSSLGVNSLAVLLELGRLVIPSDPSDARTVNLTSRLVDEMRSWPDGHTGDVLMSLWFAYTEMRDHIGEQYTVPSLFSQEASKPELDMNDTEVVKKEEHKADLAVLLNDEYERQLLYGGGHPKYPNIQ
jgi:hypothetical protein